MSKPAQTMFSLGYVAAAIKYPGFQIKVGADTLAPDGNPPDPLQQYAPWLRVVCSEGTCNETGEPLAWSGRKWRLSFHVTDGEIVQTAFKAIMTALEHEARERFTYRGAQVFNPHFDIDKLVELALSEGGVKERS